MSESRSSWYTSFAAKQDGVVIVEVYETDKDNWRKRGRVCGVVNLCGCVVDDVWEEPYETGGDYKQQSVGSCSWNKNKNFWVCVNFLGLYSLGFENFGCLEFNFLGLYSLGFLGLFLFLFFFWFLNFLNFLGFYFYFSFSFFSFS